MNVHSQSNYACLIYRDKVDCSIEPVDPRNGNKDTLYDKYQEEANGPTPTAEITFQTARKYLPTPEPATAFIIYVRHWN